MKKSIIPSYTQSMDRACQRACWTKLAVLIVLGICFIVGLSARAGDKQPFVPDQLIVAFRADVQDDQQDAVENAQGDQDVEPLRSIHARLVKIRGNRSLAQAIQEYRGHTNVLYAQPNYIYQAVETIPNDPYFNLLWAMKNTGQSINGTGGTAGADIEATLAWDKTQGTKAVVVGVVDTGVDYTHPDLAANIWSNPGNIGLGQPGTHGYNAIKGTYNPMDDNGHGTHVSGTIGAVGNNNVGVVGVNWTTSIMGLKFLDASGNGTTANAIKAIDFAVQAKIAGVQVRVLNASWGGGGPDPALLAELQKAYANDILFVAAAGNSSANNDVSSFYPANYSVEPTTPNVIAVAATDNNDLLASFSNYGATTVQLGAPGVNIASTWPGNQYYWASGTSMAAPHVTGSAALVLAAQSGLTVAQLKAAILNNVDTIPSLNGKTVTGGRLNVNHAVDTTPNFSISITPSSSAVAPGDSSSPYTVTVTPFNGFSGDVTLTLSAAPDQTVTTTLSAGTVTIPPGSAVTLTASTTASSLLGSDTITVTGTANNGTLIHTATASLVVATPATATFVNADLTTKGNWIGNYGKEGYDIVRYTSAPSYGTVTPAGDIPYTWASSTTDSRGLQTPPNGTSRFASCYYSSTSFTLDVNLQDYNTHRVSLYCLDWDTTIRDQTIEIFDRNSGASVAPPYPLPAGSFNGGQYLTWDISGPVIIKVTYNGDPAKANAVVSGIFFDPAGTPISPPAAPATITATAGNGQVTLTWGASDSATSYNVKRSTTSGGETTIATVTTTTYTDNNVVAPNAYFYVVSALNKYGESGPSAEVSATPSGVPPDFAISAAPSSRTVSRGASTSYSVTVTPSGGFKGKVTFGVGGLPSNATGTFSPSSVTGSGSSTLRIDTRGNTSRGTYPLTITGACSNPSLQHTTSVTLIVN